MNVLSRNFAVSIVAMLALVACKGDDTDETDDTDVVDTDTDVTGDTTAPTVAITDDEPAADATGDVTFTFTFSEGVGTSFTADDVTVTGGTKGAFTAVSATIATVVVSPPVDAAGTLSVDVAVGAFMDAAGNANTAAASADQDFDTTVPSTDTTLMDFDESPAPVLTGFGGAEDATVVADPTDGTNKVAKIVKSGTAETWAGTTMSYCPNNSIARLPFTATETSVSVRVWSPDAGIPVRLKVENAGNPTITVETEATTTAAGAWQELTFDFANEVMGTAALNLANTYDKVSIFPNFGTSGGAAGAKTYYVDDVVFLDAVFDADCPDPTEVEGLPISFDDSATTYTLIGFGGAEDATVVADPTDATNKVAKVVKSGTAETWAGTTMATGALESIATLPLTATVTKMTLRVWTSKTNIPVRLKVETAGDPTRSVETEARTTTVSGWQTLTFDFANEASGTAKLNPTYTYNKASVFFDFGKSGVDGGGGTYYFDDLDMAP